MSTDGSSMPKQCKIELLRRQLKAHLSMCPREVVPCPYAKAGCSVSVLRQSLQKHMTNAIDQHQFLAIDKITNLEQTVLETEMLLRTPPFTFKLENVSTKVATSTEFKSPCFYTYSDGYKMYVIVRPNLSYDGEVYVGVYVSIIEGRNDDNLIWPFKGKTTLESEFGYRSSFASHDF